MADISARKVPDVRSLRDVKMTRQRPGKNQPGFRVGTDGLALSGAARSAIFDKIGGTLQRNNGTRRKIKGGVFCGLGMWIFLQPAPIRGHRHQKAYFDGRHGASSIEQRLRVLKEPRRSIAHLSLLSMQAKDSFNNIANSL
jgi:hypothetical protein